MKPTHYCFVIAGEQSPDVDLHDMVAKLRSVFARDKVTVTLHINEAADAIRAQPVAPPEGHT